MTLKDNLPKIALGAWAWGNDGTFGNEHKIEDLKPIYDKSMELGLNLWDTAYVYGMGKSEEVLGEFLKTSNREDFVISTKFTPQLAEMFEANEVTSMYENSAKILGVEDIDIFWIHNPVGAPEWTKKLVETAKEHDIKMIGVSNHNLAEIEEANEILKEAGLKLGAVQNHYSLLNRSSEDSGILEYCKENDIIFFSYMVLEQGALSGKYDTAHPFPEGSDRANAYGGSLAEIEELNKAIAEIAENHNAKVAQLPIAWAIAKGTLPIIGATKVHHVEDAADAVNIELSDDEIKTMEELADKANVNTIRIWEKEMK
ncbi:MAG: aldo/keto reductase [Methanobrevibacter sp.]|uniref:aldo/keto reductase n=1 Tax=Methanobrevibacter sp. TaxID=66852 RepID=UPI0025F3E61B|nr:aldo/keto reductase [Methanobrevibacter sp.]MEE0941988.1 aldo/keto reductase [Methanobrevibacter sp.]